jgi:hypothetical protein
VTFTTPSSSSRQCDVRGQGVAMGATVNFAAYLTYYGVMGKYVDMPFGIVGVAKGATRPRDDVVTYHNNRKVSAPIPSRW